MFKSPRNLLITGFGAAFLMFSATSWLTYRNTQRLISAHESVSATHRILEQIGQVHLLLDEAESSCRGFALSGREAYLGPYETARAQMDLAMQILEHDLAQRPAQLASFVEIKPLIEERLKLMEELIATRREHGADPAIEFVRSDRGKRLTEDITRRLIRLQIAEQNLLLESTSESDRATRSAIYWVLFISALGLGLLLIALLFSDRAFHQRETLRAALAETEQIQRAILDSANYSIISTDANGLIRTINATAQKWLLCEPEALLGRSLTLLHDRQELENRATQLTKSMGEAVAPGFAALTAKARHSVPDEVEWTYVRPDGTRFPVAASMTALRRHDGTVGGYLAIANDLTGRREVERMKDEFVSVVSHELRTPLTSLRGALGLLAGGAVGALSERAAVMIDTALRNTDRLIRLTNDILDLARIESGRMAMLKKKTGARDLMTLSTDLVQGLANESGVSVSMNSEPVILNADPDRMVQAFSNLLTNAIKFSSAGGAVVFDNSIQGNSVLFRVKDQGRGIPREKLETIFGRFEQVDPSDSRDRGGTGLGLAICRSIVEGHGGKIWAESEMGKGSTFFVRLPLEEQNHAGEGLVEGK